MSCLTPLMYRPAPAARSRLRSTATALCLSLGLGLGLGTWLPAHAINNGTPTTAFAPVGFFGVQVAPDWVLTANHVAAAFFPIGASTIAFSNGLGERTVIDRFDAPGATGFPANDLTLLRLAPGAASSFFQPLSSDLFSVGSFAALNVTIASAANSTLPRAFGHTTVTEFAAQIDPDDDGPQGLVTVNYLLSFDASVYVQSGDSGGGLFFGHVLDSASAPLLGLSSAQLGDEGQPPAGSGFVQLAPYRSWLDATMASAAGNTQQLNWVTAIPEPGTWLLFGLGLAGLAARTALRDRAGSHAHPNEAARTYA